MNNSKILITGGAGFLGSHLAERLLEKFNNIEIVILDDLSLGAEKNLENIKNEKIQLIKGDIRDKEQVKKSVEGVDYIFHLAAMPFIPDCFSEPEIFITTNVNGTYNLIEAILKKKIKKFVLISTSEVYGSAEYIPMDEAHPLKPRSTYAASKLASENIAFTLHKEHNFPLSIIRSFNFYGPRDSHPRIIPEIISQFSKSNTLNLGNINATRDFVYVKDVADGLILAAQSENSTGKTLTLSTGEETPIKTLIDSIAHIMNIKDYKINVKEERLRPFDVDRLCGSNKEAKKILNWEPRVELKKGLKETVEWYLSKKCWPFEERLK